VHSIPGNGWSTWKIHGDDTPKEEQRKLDWDAFAKPVAIDSHTFGYRWSEDWVARPRNKREAQLFTLPEYFQLEENDENPIWNPILRKRVPVRSALGKASFVPPEAPVAEAYVTPNDGCWSKPGAVADQPALLNADLSDAEREQLQERVELLHRSWTRKRQYLPPPKLGKLASLDAALIVEPPKGFEVGYVPIVTRQGRD